MTKTKQEGFSLLELVLVLSLMGIVLAMATPAIVSSIKSWEQIGEKVQFEDEKANLPIRLFEDIKQELGDNEANIVNNSLYVGDVRYTNDNGIMRNDSYPFTNNPEWEAEFNKEGSMIQITLLLNGEKMHQTSIQENWR